MRAMADLHASDGLEHGVWILWNSSTGQIGTSGDNIQLVSGAHILWGTPPNGAGWIVIGHMHTHGVKTGQIRPSSESSDGTGDLPTAKKLNLPGAVVRGVRYQPYYPNGKIGDPLPYTIQ